jgi:hypothetical protein
MLDPAARASLARIETALARIESVARHPASPGESDSRYQALRARTQAALASLETVIAQVGAGGGRR